MCKTERVCACVNDRRTIRGTHRHKDCSCAMQGVHPAL